ncbi:MAG: DedA family protein [Cytophagaceae bacterium]|nr:DedA family protein [Cytophagaceae bacterium]
MDLIKQALDYFLHLDDELKKIVTDYQNWTYLILFIIIFVETGLVIMPFLPGDSLLFVAGSLAAAGSLNIFYIIILLFLAAFLGDTVNYLLGNYIGPKVFKRDFMLLKRDHLIKTQIFFEKHGPKTIIIARFIPIIRTFAPFIAGVGTMNYGRFISYNILGGAIWVVGLTLLGYFFGQIPFVKENFETVIIGIIILSIMPPVIEYIRAKYFNKKAI